MKCVNCGAGIQIEDEKCPFCGTPNPFAVQHRQDMQQYRVEFQDTKKKVEQRSIRFTALSVKLTVIAVLFAAVIGMIYMLDDGIYDIRMHQILSELARNREEYAERLAAYERDGDWNLLYDLYVENSLSYDETFKEYYVLYYASFDYTFIVEYLMHYGEGLDYYSAEDVAKWIAAQLEGFYDCVNRRGSFGSDFYDECYTGVHKEALERICRDMETLLMTYAGLTREELDTLQDYSRNRQVAIIEEALLRKADNAEGADSTADAENEIEEDSTEDTEIRRIRDEHRKTE